MKRHLSLLALLLPALAGCGGSGDALLSAEGSQNIHLHPDSTGAWVVLAHYYGVEGRLLHVGPEGLPDEDYAPFDSAAPGTYHFHASGDALLLIAYEGSGARLHHRRDGIWTRSSTLPATGRADYGYGGGWLWYRDVDDHWTGHMVGEAGRLGAPLRFEGASTDVISSGLTGVVIARRAGSTLSSFTRRSSTGEEVPITGSFDLHQKMRILRDGTLLAYGHHTETHTAAITLAVAPLDEPMTEVSLPAPDGRSFSRVIEVAGTSLEDLWMLRVDYDGHNCGSLNLFTCDSSEAGDGTLRLMHSDGSSWSEVDALASGSGSRFFGTPSLAELGVGSVLLALEREVSRYVAP